MLKKLLSHYIITSTERPKRSERRHTMSKFYICKICGNIIEKIEDSGLAPYCCAKKMTLLDPEEAEGPYEKHVPVITVSQAPCCDDNKKTALLIHAEVGSQLHPSLNNHYIKWIQLETDKGAYRHMLTPDDKPIADFVICSTEKPLAVYSYCNQHGLWVGKTFST